MMRYFLTIFPNPRIKIWRLMTERLSLQISHHCNIRVKMWLKNIFSKFRSSKSLLAAIRAWSLVKMIATRSWIIPRMMSSPTPIKDGYQTVTLISSKKRRWTSKDRRGARFCSSKEGYLRARTKKWKGCVKIRSLPRNVDWGRPKSIKTSVKEQRLCDKKSESSAKKKQWWIKRSKFSEKRFSDSGNSKLAWCSKKDRKSKPKLHKALLIMLKFPRALIPLRILVNKDINPLIMQVDPASI